MLIRLFLFITLVMASCKTTKPVVQPSAPGAVSGSPMTCQITGRIVELIKDKSDDTTDICSQHPCKAIVEIIGFDACGASVSLKYQQGDKVTMKFAFTLDDTKNIFPKMKAHFSGLKVGDIFTATAHQHLQMGSDGIFVVYDYTRQ